MSPPADSMFLVRSSQGLLGLFHTRQDALDAIQPALSLPASYGDRLEGVEYPTNYQVSEVPVGKLPDFIFDRSDVPDGWKPGEPAKLSAQDKGG